MLFRGITNSGDGEWPAKEQRPAKKDPTATPDHKMPVRQYHNTIRGKNKLKIK